MLVPGCDRDTYLSGSKFVILSIAVLHDDFGFGEKRCRRFRNGLDRAADYINDGLAEWIDYVDAIKEELGIVLKNPGE